MHCLKNFVCYLYLFVIHIVSRYVLSFIIKTSFYKYQHKRNFSVINLIQSNCRLTPNLRGYAEPLTNAMVEFYLASQERFTQDMQPHYVYSPREMTRWVRGICEAIRPLDNLSVEGLVRLWAHEALRLFQDRLVEESERAWTNKNIDIVALKHFMSVDRERALARPILYSNWLSKDYVPVNREELRDYVRARLKVFYEEELDVPLVLFDEVLEHVLRIDRIFRQPQGHLLLIGVSGAGKTTLSRFVAWMNGLSIFQIKVILRCLNNKQHLILQICFSNRSISPIRYTINTPVKISMKIYGRY